MALKPLWKGTKDLKEDPNSPKFENSASGPRYTRIFTGPYQTADSKKPARLVNMVGTPASFYVDTVEVAKMPGGRGQLTVTLTPAPQQDYSTEGNATLEVEWVEVQKKIETHPHFAALSPKLREKVQEVVDGKRSIDTLASSLATALAERLLAGQDSYVVYSPVARRTTKHSTPPATSACGKREMPPADIAIAGYVYLKTADRRTRDRTWSRVEEWTGGLEIDELIYPAA